MLVDMSSWTADFDGDEMNIHFPREFAFPFYTTEHRF